MSFELDMEFDMRVYGQISEEEAAHEHHDSLRQFGRKLQMTEAGKTLTLSYIQDFIRIPNYGMAPMDKHAERVYLEVTAEEYIKKAEANINNSANPEDGAEFTIPRWDSKDGRDAEFWLPRYFFA